MMVEQLIGITDTAFLGHIGEVELGASAIAGVFYLILFVTGSGFGVGLQILIARLNGEKNLREIPSIFSTGIYFLMLIAFVIVGSVRFFMPDILGWFIKSPDIHSAAVQYLNWRIFGLFFSFTIVAFRAFYVGTVNTRILTFCSTIMVLVNIVCNYIFIFGKFGVPAMGIAGAGLGSTIAEASAAILFIIYYKSKRHEGHFASITEFRLHAQNIARIFNLSTWTMAQAFLSLSSWLYFFVAIEHIGTEQLAVANIVRSLSSIPFMLTMAFTSTGSSLVSNLIGEGESKEMIFRLCRKVLIISATFCAPLLIFGAVFPRLALSIYTDNGTLINAAVVTFYVMLTSYIISIPSSVYYSALAGTGQTFLSFKIEVAALIVYVLFVTIAARFTSSIAILWLSEHIYASILFILSFRMIHKASWLHKKI